MHLSRCGSRIRSTTKLQAINFASKSHLSTGRERFFRVSEEVQDALSTGKPVVALETTIYTHGFPYPENVGLASHLESLVRVNGGIPATIGILNGVAHVGMGAEELIELVSTAGSEDTWKLSRRDLGFITGLGITGKKLNGGTTIAGTMILAHLAGIKIFATGGLGGVHRGGENSMDISADLTELGRTPVAVISSGCKSFLDIPRTLEYLETQGVGVGTFADGRTGKVDFPAFFSRDSGLSSPKVIQDEAEAAAIVYAQSQLQINSGLLFANPVPEIAAMAKDEINSIIQAAVAEAEEKGISGSANTPYILKRIRELSNGGSVKANKALIEANVIRGTKVAVELAKLELRDKVAAEGSVSGSARTVNHTHQVSEKPVLSTLNGSLESKILDNSPDLVTKPVEVLVVGALASDTICDYSPYQKPSTKTPPLMETSNPSSISQSVGGVGRNVAVAAHLAGANVVLASVVANDLAGSALLDHVSTIGMSTQNIRILDKAHGARTAQYVAVNDSGKDLVVAMADMSIFERQELEEAEYWISVMKLNRPKWVVIDANWSSRTFNLIIKTAKSYGCQVAFEPVSTAKAARLFQKSSGVSGISNVNPNHGISLATPNVFELAAIHQTAQDNDYFGTEEWWNIVNCFNMSSSGSTDRFTALTSRELVKEGVPQRCIQLLPYIPNLVTKLGSRGCLLTSVLEAGDVRLTDPQSTPYILAHGLDAHYGIGGVYMRLFPPSELVPPEKIVSVNGVGDTMLGVIMAGLARNKTLQDIIPVAQKAAVLTIQSKEAVAPEVVGISDLLK